MLKSRRLGLVNKMQRIKLAFSVILNDFKIPWFLVILY